MNNNQTGVINKLAVPLIFVTICLLIAVVFGIWAFSGQQSYKNNTNKKIAVAVSMAQQQQKTADETSNAAAQENLLPYHGPPVYGSLSLLYPKNWSAYVITASADDNSSTPINGYFQPGILPDVSNSANVFALRVQILQQTYDQVVTQYQSLAQGGTVTVNAYSLPKVPNDVGIRVDGAIEQNIQGSMVILPLRETTLEIWTESTAEESDFNNIILPNVSFSP